MTATEDRQPFVVGDVVTDEMRYETGTVRSVYGNQVRIARPSGLDWWALESAVRRATTREVAMLQTSMSLQLKQLGATAS
ncbi:hypothetical protein [Streptomyces zhihengii]|uniref:Uncharacterized protein n=1 Tax=Streptomyces zhihengii TaxID=1818004 RepID=A0ABS2V545_9ACTN|nr:hypothetical protein [Streptomyces zhihengii]MBM9624594.1 hypothetical protein [Streptomyces zhihengii]